MPRALLIAALLLPVFPGAPLPAAAQAGSGAATPHHTDPALGAADSLVAAWVASGRVPGAVLLVLRHGQPILENAYGHARLMEYAQGEYGASQAGEDRPEALRRMAEPVPMTTATAFDLASVTKVMATTFAVMLLADRGALDVDAPAWRYLPDFRGGGKDDVTVRHLLSHTAGLQQWVPTYDHASDADAAYAYVRDLPLGWPVGEGRHYSDLGFMVLGRLVEGVAGRPLDAFLRDELFGPLGLEDTGFRRRGGSGERPVAATSHGNPYEHRMVHDSTFGYRIPGDPSAWDGWRRYTLAGEVNDGNAWHGWGGVAGHAGLFSTARDLSVLLRLLLDGGEHHGRRHLRAETVEAFLEPAVEGQALGWQLPAYAPAGSFAHTGFTGAWVLGVPARGMAVVLLTNRQHLGVDQRGLYPDLGPLQRGVAAALLGPAEAGPTLSRRARPTAPPSTATGPTRASPRGRCRRPPRPPWRPPW
jgi:CubicO group peptidase (beta-lactamase class C family)